MSTIVEPSREAVGVPPASSASLVRSTVPARREWVERINAAPGRMQWPCPLAECEAILPSAAFAAEHLMDWHGWSEYDIADWWAK